MNSRQDRGNFLSVIETNKGIIYKVANSYCKDDEDRKDLVQEIIFQLWQSFGKYDEQYKISTWMYRIALNVAISFYRKSTRRKYLSAPFTETIINIADNKEHVELEKDISLLQQFISELGELDRALILLYLENKSYREIADILGITETNVATKISRVKDKLKQKFNTVKH